MKSDNTIGTIGTEVDLKELNENIIRSNFSDYLLLDDVLRSQDSPETVWPPFGAEDCSSEAEGSCINLLFNLYMYSLDKGRIKFHNSFHYSKFCNISYTLAH